MDPEVNLPSHFFSSFLHSGAQAPFVCSKPGYSKGLFVHTIDRSLAILHPQA